MSKKVYLRPVVGTSAQERRVYKIIDGEKKEVTKTIDGSTVGFAKSFGGTFTFQISPRSSDGRLAINLDKLVANPFYQEDEKDVQLPSQWSNSTIWKKPRITRQEELELKYNKKPGFFATEGFRVNGNKKPWQQERTYLQQLQRIFSASQNELDLTVMDDELIYEAVLESKFFANTLEEITGESRFYISHIDQEQEKLADKRRNRIKASALLDSLIDNHPTKLYKVAVVLTIIQGSVSESVIKNKLFDYVEEKNFGSIPQDERIARFIDVCKQATDESIVEKEKFDIQFLGQELINFRVVNDYRGKYTWISKSGSNLEEIARTKQEFYDFLADPKNEVYVEELRTELDSKK